MNKREARTKIDSLITSTKEALTRYGQLGEIKYREPTDLLDAQRYLKQAKELSEQYEALTELVELNERNVVGSFSDWDKERQQLINSQLKSGGPLSDDFNRWIQEYQNCFPDKKHIITQWQEQKKAIAGDTQQFETDFVKTQQIVQSLRQEADKLHAADRENNEVVAVGKVREAYDKAEALKNNYPLEQRAIDLAEQAKQDYEHRKQEWHLGLMTQAGAAKFTEVIALLKQLKNQGVKTTRDVIITVNEDGEIDKTPDEELQLKQGEELPVDAVIDHVEDAKITYAHTKKNQYIRLADNQLDLDPQGAINTLTDFCNQNKSLLEQQHTTPINHKLAEYQERLKRRQAAIGKVEEAETEPMPEKAWGLILQAEAQDKNFPELPRVKNEVAQRLQIYLKQVVLPPYNNIKILDGTGEDSWDYHLNRLADLKKLTTGHDLLADIDNELQLAIKSLENYRALDNEVKEKIPKIKAGLTANPQQADVDLNPIEEKIAECGRTAFYLQLQSIRQLINAYINFNQQKQDWYKALGNKEQWFENLTAIEMAQKDTNFGQDKELQQLYQSYQARIRLQELQDDKEEGLLSEGLEKEIEVIEQIARFLKEADDQDTQLARAVREIKQWLHQKQADYQRIKNKLAPVVTYIQNNQFTEANTQLEALKQVYPDDPTLKQQGRDLRGEWGAFLTNRLITRLGSIQTIQQAESTTIHKILRDIDQLQTLGGPGAVSLFQELKAACYLRLASLDRRQERKWLEDAENIVPEASPTYFEVASQLAELRKDDDFHKLADLQNSKDKLPVLETMRVKYKDDVKVLQMLTETYLKCDEPLKAENIVDQLEQLQRRDRIKIDLSIITNLKNDIQNVRQVHTWRAKVKKQLSDQTSVAALSEINKFITDEKELPIIPITTELTAWFERAKTDYISQLLIQASEARKRNVDLIGLSQKLIRVWALIPDSFEAKETLEELADYSAFELQSNLEIEANDTTGQESDAPDWLHKQIERASGLIDQAKQVEDILRFYFREDAKSREEKVNPIGEQTKKLITHRNELKRLQRELAQLNRDLDRQRRSRNTDSSDWEPLVEQANDLQTGSGKYSHVNRFTKHLAVLDFYKRVGQSQVDQRELQKLFKQLEKAVAHSQYQVARTCLTKIKAISKWDEYRFEDEMNIVWHASHTIRSLRSLEVELETREDIINQMWHWFNGYLNTVEPWQAIPIWWQSLRQEDLLTDQELAFQLTNYITADKPAKSQFLGEAVQTYHKKLKKDNNATFNRTTILEEMSQHKSRGEWQKAFEVCQEALWGKQAVIVEKLPLIKKEIEKFIEMSPLVPPDEEFVAGSWYEFLRATQQYLNLPENWDQRAALELVHFETIRQAVTEWLREMKQELDKLGKDYQIFMNNYRIVQESLSTIQKGGLFKQQAVENARKSGKRAFEKCKEICPKYPFSQAIRDQFESM